LGEDSTRLESVSERSDPPGLPVRQKTDLQTEAIERRDFLYIVTLIADNRGDNGRGSIFAGRDFQPRF
jgi:hypothetical protein